MESPAKARNGLSASEYSCAKATIPIKPIYLTKAPTLKTNLKTVYRQSAHTTRLSLTNSARVSAARNQLAFFKDQNPISLPTGRQTMRNNQNRRRTFQRLDALGECSVRFQHPEHWSLHPVAVRKRVQEPVPERMAQPLSLTTWITGHRLRPAWSAIHGAEHPLKVFALARFNARLTCSSVARPAGRRKVEIVANSAGKHRRRL